MDDRQQQLKKWVSGQLGRRKGEWETVAGDASSRRYFRLRDAGESWICVDAPSATEKNREFLQLRDWLESRGVLVPALLAVDVAQGYMLQGDLGSELLLDHLREDTVDAHYEQALLALRHLYREPPEQGVLPDYSETVLREELSRFPAWFCEGLLQYEPDASDRAALADCFDRLVASALEQPRVFVHRDFHARNLLLQSDGSLGIIDFQDALYGPMTYDVVSLLKDCYIRWPRQRVIEWLEAHRVSLLETGMQGLPDAQGFLHWFDWMGLQRHLKVLGTFARLSLRDGKQAYLQDLPLVLAYTREVLATNSEFLELEKLFRDRLDPLINLQGWSNPA